MSSWLVYLFLKNVKVGVSFQVMSCSSAAQGNVQKSLLQVQSCCFFIKPIAILKVVAVAVVES